MSNNYQASVPPIIPISFTIIIIVMCNYSKIALYFCLPILIAGYLGASFYACIICPFKEKNGENFNYKKCVRQSLNRLMCANFFTYLTTLLIVILCVSNIVIRAIFVFTIALYMLFLSFKLYSIFEPKNNPSSESINSSENTKPNSNKE